MKKRNNKKEPRQRIKITRTLIFKYLLGLIALLGTIVVVYQKRIPEIPSLELDQIAFHNIQAQVDFDYIDENKTEILRRKAETEVDSLYFINPEIYQGAHQRIEELFAALTALMEKELPQKEKLQMLEQTIPWLDQETLTILLKEPKLGPVKENIVIIARDVLERGVISNTRKIRIISTGDDSLTFRDYNTQEIVEVNVDKFLVYNELENVIDSRVRSLHPFNRSLRDAMKNVLLSILSVNLAYDSVEVSQRRQSARSAVIPVRRRIRQGQTIIRSGDLVTELHSVQLEAHRKKLLEMLPRYSRWWKLGGYILLCVIFLSILSIYLHYHQSEIFSCNKRLFLLIIISLATLALARFIAYIPADIEKPFWQFFIVIPISAMLVAILIDKELAIMMAVVLGILAAVATENTLAYTIVALFGSIIAVRSTARLLHRWEFIKAGIYIGVAQLVAIIMVNLLRPFPLIQSFWPSIIYQGLGGFFSGPVCAIIVFIFLPVFERAFNITTNIRLLELSDLNHPLLKMLVTKAPGTYHHSIAVSNMAEDAAAAIGGNPLLAKVASYFHDIGKTAKPDYFVENVWFREESMHEKLPPTMSHLVITAHVKDGVQLAKRYKLPQAITDIIAEHHGTSLVYFFYIRAEKASIDKGIKIEEGDFKYPGPRPWSKESGIILLADACEAASKTLVKPTPQKIKDLVKEIIDEKLIDGQLEDCGLTLKDIAIVRDRFTHIVTGMLHKRIEYPEKDKNGNNG